MATAQDLTATELVSIYQNMMTEDQIDIFVIGDVQPDPWKQFLLNCPLK